MEKVERISGGKRSGSRGSESDLPFKTSAWERKGMGKIRVIRERQIKKMKRSDQVGDYSMTEVL